MIKAKISRCNNFKMAGEELRRLRTEAGLSQKQLAKQMSEWGWNRDKVYYLESQAEFELVPQEMEALLTALGASSIYRLKFINFHFCVKNSANIPKNIPYNMGSEN